MQKNKSEDDGQEASQGMLKDVMRLIRFPTMTLEELTTVVAPTGVLSQDTLATLFTYHRGDKATKLV